MSRRYFQTGSVWGGLSGEDLVGFGVVQSLAAASIIGESTWIESEQEWRLLYWESLVQFGLAPDWEYLADFGRGCQSPAAGNWG